MADASSLSELTHNLAKRKIARSKREQKLTKLLRVMLPTKDDIYIEEPYLLMSQQELLDRCIAKKPELSDLLPGLKLELFKPLPVPPPGLLYFR
jgi:hypothetical protein